MHTRTVFFVSDGTGITAETFGNAILAQFDLKPRHVRMPFTDTVDKAHQAVRQINHTAELEGKKPVVFTTLVNMDVLKVIQDGCKGMLMDMFGTFVRPLEQELGIKSLHRVGRFADVALSKEYTDRIEAINFSLAHDDGQSHRDLAGADVILVGVSRSGKTPTSLYLAMQCGLKAANYPLIPEDFERRQLGADAVGQAFKGQKFAERMGGGGEPGGHAHALRQLGDHLAEAGVFTANGLDIGHSQVFKRYDQGGRAEKCRHGRAPEVKTGSARPPEGSKGRAAMHGLQLCRCGCWPTGCMVRIG